MTPAQALADHRMMIDAVGEEVTFRRYSGLPPSRSIAASATVKARVTGYQPDELVGGVGQGDRRLIVLDEGLDAIAPLKVGDNEKVVVRGREMTIAAVDDSTRRIAGTLIAYEVRASG